MRPPRGLRSDGERRYGTRQDAGLSVRHERAPRASRRPEPSARLDGEDRHDDAREQREHRVRRGRSHEINSVSAASRAFPGTGPVAAPAASSSSRSPAATCWPSRQATWATRPANGAHTGCSIFIASSTSSTACAPRPRRPRRPRAAARRPASARRCARCRRPRPPPAARAARARPARALDADVAAVEPDVQRAVGGARDGSAGRLRPHAGAPAALPGTRPCSAAAKCLGRGDAPRAAARRPGCGCQVRSSQPVSTPPRSNSGSRRSRAGAAGSWSGRARRRRRARRAGGRARARASRRARRAWPAARRSACPRRRRRRLRHRRGCPGPRGQRTASTVPEVGRKPWSASSA